MKLLLVWVGIILVVSLVAIILLVPGENKGTRPKDFVPSEWRGSELALISANIRPVEEAVRAILAALDEEKNNDQKSRAILRAIMDKVERLKSIAPKDSHNKTLDDISTDFKKLDLPETEDLADAIELLQKKLTVRWQPNLEAVQRGGALYREMCMTCHGVNGDAVSVTPEKLPINPRDLTGKSHIQKRATFKFTTAKSIPAFEADLEKTIQSGLPGTPMPGFENLRDEEISAIIEYVKTFGYLDWKYGNPAEESVKPPPIPSDLGSPERVNAGRENYKTLCLTCHGDIEHGGLPEQGKVLDWIDKEGKQLPIVPRNFAVEPLRRGKVEDMYATIQRGIRGTPMPANNIGNDDCWNLISYVLYLRDLASKHRLPVKK